MAKHRRWIGPTPYDYAIEQVSSSRLCQVIERADLLQRRDAYREAMNSPEVLGLVQALRSMLDRAPGQCPGADIRQMIRAALADYEVGLEPLIVGRSTRPPMVIEEPNSSKLRDYGTVRDYGTDSWPTRGGIGEAPDRPAERHVEEL